MRWLLPLLLGFTVASCGLCGGDGNEDGNGNGLSGPNGTDRRTVVEFWHSMSSLNQVALQRIVDEFNESHSDYRVEPIYQGGYGDSLTKLINSLGSGDIPTLFQADDVSTQILIDSEEMTPVQQFIDDEDYDLSDYDPKALAYYTVNDTLYSMPFNPAGPILIYDREAFREAGLDPDRPPQTLDDVRAYSEQLVRRDAQGNVTRYGISLQISPWLFEQMLAKSGGPYVDHENGRAGRAVEAAFDSEAGLEIIRWWDEMVESGLGYNAGREDRDALLKFAGGEATMVMGSSAVLAGGAALLTLLGGNTDQYGTAPLPAPAGDGGIVLGGGSLWVVSRASEGEREGAWEFIKFASSAEQQAQWHVDTGYLPVRLSAYDLPVAVQRREQFPQFTTAVEQLRVSPDTPAARGALLGPFNEVRDRIRVAFELVLTAGADPAEELES
ncbi:MAG: ABC transporter substrate-binding protein, partial [Dehalococcoidia bacterium]